MHIPQAGSQEAPTGAKSSSCRNSDVKEHLSRIDLAIHRFNRVSISSCPSAIESILNQTQANDVLETRQSRRNPRVMARHATVPDTTSRRSYVQVSHTAERTLDVPMQLESTAQANKERTTKPTVQNDAQTKTKEGLIITIQQSRREINPRYNKRNKP